MKRYTSCLGREAEIVHPHPERTGRQILGLWGETTVFQIWPNRAALLKTIEMQERREIRNDDWKAIR